MNSWKHYIPYVAGALLLLALLYGYSLELLRFQRSFGPGRMVLSSALLGLVPGILLGWYFSRGMYDLTERIRVYLLSVFFGVLFGPLFGAWANRLLSPHPERIESVYFIEEIPYQGFRLGSSTNRKASGYYCFFIYNDSMRRISVSAPIAGNRSKGDTLPIRMRKGLFGVEWVILPSPTKH
jgi:hypothetical protein